MEIKEAKNMQEKGTVKTVCLLGIAGLCMLLVGCLAICIVQNGNIAMDATIYQWIAKWRSNSMTQIAKIVTMMGSAAVLITIAALALLGKDRKLGLFISANLIMIAITNFVLKWLIQRPRPDEALRLVQERGFSFPSGHSMVSMAFYGLLIYIIWGRVKNRYKRYAICGGLAILIVLIGMSRIYLGVHYATDVMGGFLLSIAYLIGITSLIAYLKKSEENKK